MKLQILIVIFAFAIGVGSVQADITFDGKLVEALVTSVNKKEINLRYTNKDKKVVNIKVSRNALGKDIKVTPGVTKMKVVVPK